MWAGAALLGWIAGKLLVSDPALVENARGIGSGERVRGAGRRCRRRRCRDCGPGSPLLGNEARLTDADRTRVSGDVGAMDKPVLDAGNRQAMGAEFLSVARRVGIDLSAGSRGDEPRDVPSGRRSEIPVPGAGPARHGLRLPRRVPAEPRSDLAREARSARPSRLACAASWIKAVAAERAIYLCRTRDARGQHRQRQNAAAVI